MEVSSTSIQNSQLTKSPLGDLGVKVCGMRSAENIRQIEQLGVDWMGFIFYPKSPRFVSEFPSYLPVKTKRVGVFVNETKDNITKTATRFALDFVQLHGNESPEFCVEMGKIGLKVIKAFSIGNEFPSEEVNRYEGVCNYFLFDTKTPQHGGSGRKFNWEILSNYIGNTPFLLSGGISPKDAESIRQFNHPKLIGIDINSKFETNPALKDVELVKIFINKLCQRSEL
ncbi:phosphoribosylanthranilate isomerase [Petrimonas sp.]|uniref:phosphoribosylanthranilate isomerase n=1 Tax=Petrimonas sp. TaxID=2023866 RepID=UPI003F510ED2